MMIRLDAVTVNTERRGSCLCEDRGVPNEFAESLYGGIVVMKSAVGCDPRTGLIAPLEQIDREGHVYLPDEVASSCYQRNTSTTLEPLRTTRRKAVS
jgi:hypothetical protein